MKIDGKRLDPELVTADYNRLMQMQQDRPDDMKAPEDEVRQLARINVVNRFLLLREARQRFAKVTERDITKQHDRMVKERGTTFPLDPYREQAADDVRLDRLIRQLHHSVQPITEAEARSVYDADPAAWTVPEQVHCSHIVRHTFGSADPSAALTQIMEAQRLLKSGQSFELVARRFSDRFGQAGDLGTFPRGQMVEKFDNVVFRIKPGKVSDVFQTQFGYHIVLLHEKVPPRERTFKEAQSDIVRSILNQRHEKAVSDYIEELRGSAKIDEDD